MDAERKAERWREIVADLERWYFARSPYPSCTEVGDDWRDIVDEAAKRLAAAEARAEKAEAAENARLDEMDVLHRRMKDAEAERDALRAKLDAAEARAERAEAESDALQGDIDSIQERWHDAVAAIHVALGGDGEWKAHAGAQPPIEESGHLHLASKAMAENLVAERDRLRGEVEAWRRGCALVGNLCEHGGRALNRPECREVGDA